MSDASHQLSSLCKPNGGLEWATQLSPPQAHHTHSHRPTSQIPGPPVRVLCAKLSHDAQLQPLLLVSLAYGMPSTAPGAMLALSQQWLASLVPSSSHKATLPFPRVKRPSPASASLFMLPSGGPTIHPSMSSHHTFSSRILPARYSSFTLCRIQILCPSFQQSPPLMG